MQSSPIYSFICAHCASKYVGSTIRIIVYCIRESLSIVVRVPMLCCSTLHTLSHQMLKQYFKFKNLESLYIHKLKPILNSDKTAALLFIVNTKPFLIIYFRAIVFVGNQWWIYPVSKISTCLGYREK